MRRARLPGARPHDAPALGVVYTPADVARAMVELALAPLLEQRDVLDLRICDPAVGEGAFLVEVVKFLVERTGVDAKTIRERCIYGVDVDARAVEAARRVLGTDNIRVGNALSLDWAELGVDGFDLVIGNPPYIRQELLADKATLRAFASYDGVADLYVYFIELAHRIARPGGRWCLITPNKWLTVAYAKPLRAFLAKQASVEGVVDMRGARVFDEDAFPCVVWGTVERSTAPIHAVRGDLSSRRGHHDRARWTEAPWHIDEPEDRALIDELHARWPAFDTIGKPARGIVTGANDVFVVDRATRDRLCTDERWLRPFVKGRDLRPYRAAFDERYLLLIDHGTELDELPAAIVDYLTPFRDKLEPGTGRKPGRYRWYELQDPVGAHSISRAPRLFYQDIQSGPACCLDESGLVPDTTVWTLNTDDRYLLGVLNSPLYGWYAQRRFPPALNGSVRPKRAYIGTLPIATPSASARARIEALVDERLRQGDDELDRAIAGAVMDAYDLTATQRAVVARAGGDRGRSAARRSRA